MTLASATTFEYTNGKAYLLIASGGDVTVERYTGGAWETVAGSPVLDGEEKRVLTATENRLLRLTPSVSMEISFIPIRE